MSVGNQTVVSTKVLKVSYHALLISVACGGSVQPGFFSSFFFSLSHFIWNLVGLQNLKGILSFVACGMVISIS